jgi:ribose transport system permease protein
LTLAISNSQFVVGPPNFLVKATTEQLFGLPYPVYFAIVLAAAVWFVLEQTPFGRYVYFTGEGREVARLSGLPVDRVRVLTLLASTLFCGLAGVINFGYLGSADPVVGSTFLLAGSAAECLGATTIRPGRFHAWGTVVAVYVLVVGVTGLELLGGAGWTENVFNGGALVVAVTFAHLIGKTRSRGTDMF